jgi:hypothetical protein
MEETEIPINLVRAMNLIVKYNNKQFKLPLISSADNGNDAITSAAEEEGAIKYPRTLGELRELVANQTGCDIKTMKLLWKGNNFIPNTVAEVNSCL